MVIWEKGGTLQEATIITDGVAQDATGEAADGALAGGDATALDKATANGIPTDLNASGGASVVQQFAQQPQGTALQLSEAEAAKLLASAGVSGGQVLDLSQLQLVDEEGNPIQGLSGDQLLILQDGTLAVSSCFFQVLQTF